jgi:uncharacterized membrane protein YcjF (UPF0283 family)
LGGPITINNIMALDPKTAAKLGKAYGDGITDAVFGIVDDVRNAKNIKASNNAKIAAKNKITEINNQIVRNNNALREQAMREIAAEAEASALAKMTPAQRQAYKDTKAANAAAAQRAAKEAVRKREEFWQYFWAFVIILISIPVLGGAGYLLLKLAH